MPTQVTIASEPADHVFCVLFRIPGAVDADGYAQRVYGDPALEDGLLGGPDSAGVFDLDFERTGASFSRTVLDAIRDLQNALPEAEILRVGPDELVSVAAIAERVGRSHESVRLLAHNKRGPGGFPAPAGHLDAKTKAWRWSEVARWFRDVMGADEPAVPNAAFLAALNDILDLRRLADDAIDEPHVARDMASLLPTQLLASAR